MKRKSKKTNVNLARKVADQAFSKYIRERDKFICITCGKQGDKYNIDAGHFISRSYLSIRYDEQNVHAQCIGCNKYKSGAWTDYEEALIQKYGIDTVERLKKKRNELSFFTIIDYLRIEKEYKEKLAFVQQKEYN